MRVKFETAYRGFLGLLAIALLWSLWFSGRATTNAAPAADPAVSVEKETATEVYLTFGLDRISVLREQKLLGEALWKYVASLLYILLAFYVSRLIDRITRVWLKRLAARTETTLDDLLLELLRGPVKVVAFVLLINIGLTLFDWSDKAKLYLFRTLTLIVAGSLTYLAVRILDLLLAAWKRRLAHDDRKLNEQLFTLVRKSVIAFVVIVAVLVTAQNLGINMTAAIASLSIGGLAVGLAAQDTLANLFGAIAVLTDKPFRVGDTVRFDSTEGTVESIGLRSTRIRNVDGYLVAVPNKAVGNAAITNMTERSNIKTTMNLALSRTLHGDKVRRALAILEEIYRGHPMTHDVWISFNQFTAGIVNIQVVHWWKGTDYQRYLAGMQEMNLAVKDRFDAEAIVFA